MKNLYSFFLFSVVILLISCDKTEILSTNIDSEKIITVNYKYTSWRKDRSYDRYRYYKLYFSDNVVQKTEEGDSDSTLIQYDSDFTSIFSFDEDRITFANIYSQNGSRLDTYHEFKYSGDNKLNKVNTIFNYSSLDGQYKDKTNVQEEDEKVRYDFNINDFERSYNYSSAGELESIETFKDGEIYMSVTIIPTATENPIYDRSNNPIPFSTGSQLYKTWIANDLMNILPQLKYIPEKIIEQDYQNNFLDTTYLFNFQYEDMILSQLSYSTNWDYENLESPETLGFVIE